jgi:2-polyprenyl-3-methyl-5-hydroxy-6-metoxy-1,4-benzoquinol methylase
MGAMVHRACPVCGGTFQLVYIDHQHRRIARCNTCSHVFVQNPPPWETIVGHYQGMEYFQSNYNHQGIHSIENDSEWTIWLNERLDGLDRMLSENTSGTNPLSILEVGCMEGRLLSALAARGHEVCGCDLNTEIVDRGREYLALDLRAGTVSECFSCWRKQDLVLAYHVLHFTLCPTESLASWVRLLKPGGQLLLEVPLGGSDYNYHLCLHFFTSKSVRALAEAFFSEFELLENSYFDGQHRLAHSAILKGLTKTSPARQPGNPKQEE